MGHQSMGRFYVWATRQACSGVDVGPRPTSLTIVGQKSSVGPFLHGPARYPLNLLRRKELFMRMLAQGSLSRRCFSCWVE